MTKEDFKDRAKSFSMVAALSLGLGLAVVSEPGWQSSSVLPGIEIFGGFWVALALVHIFFMDHILTPMIKKDLEDFEKGEYWTPFGMKKFPPHL